MQTKSGLTLALAIALVAFGSLVAVADELETQEGAEALSVSIAGMTVFIDEETGEFRTPTAEEAAVLSEAMQRLFGPSLAAPESFDQRDFAGGAVGVDLGLSQLAFSVATLGADGEIEHDCARTAADAKDHIHGQIAAQEEK